MFFKAILLIIWHFFSLNIFLLSSGILGPLLAAAVVPGLEKCFGSPFPIPSYRFPSSILIILQVHCFCCLRASTSSLENDHSPCIFFSDRTILLGLFKKWSLGDLETGLRMSSLFIKSSVSYGTTTTRICLETAAHTSFPAVPSASVARWF